MCTAILDKFDGALCDHVLQRTGSALLLEELSARELFMLAVENQPGWFRYHALLLTFLNSRLLIEQPQLISALHSRAADYFLARNDHDQALQHAQRSGDEALFSRLLESSCAAWIPRASSTNCSSGSSPSAKPPCSPARTCWCRSSAP